MIPEDVTKAELDAQRADHFQYLYEQASEGKCGASGLSLKECKASICDCFDFTWVKPEEPVHEFTEDINDYSMCICGVPQMTHDTVYPKDPT